MTKKYFLKLAMTLVVAFIFKGVMGQEINHTEDPQTQNYVSASEDTYQTVGFNFTLYAEPDAFYSPGYTGAGDRGDGLNAASEWRWVYGFSWEELTDGGPVAEEVKGWTAAQNWVEITPALAGTPEAGDAVTFWVKEQFGAAGCPDGGTGQSHVVNFVGTPSITNFVGTTTNDWEGADNDYIKCSPAIAELSVTLEEIGSIEALREYSYNISVVRNYWDGTGWEPDTGYGTQTISVTGEVGYNHTIPNGATALEYYNDGANRTTEYLFTLADNTLTSRISSVSAIRANQAAPVYGDLAIPGNTIRYVVALPPTTGPIYHIPNDITL